MRKLGILIIMIALKVISVGAGEFKADKHTLLLTNFNKSTKKAEYSIGPSLFSGTGATLVEGYHGKGLLLKPLPLTLDLLNKCEDTTPAFTGWGPLLDGNIRQEAGTIECFVKPSRRSNGFMNPFIARNVKDGKNYTGFRISLDIQSISWVLPLWGEDSSAKYSGKEYFKKISGFESNLKEDWHHFALTWTKGEAVIYLDGRILKAFDLKDKDGLAIMNNARQFFNMEDCTIDSFRVSDIPRYSNNFEPNWRDGKRPEYAFTGNPNVERYKTVEITPPIAECYKSVDSSKKGYQIGDFKFIFNNNGQLLSLNDSQIVGSDGHGLILHEGFGRKLIKPVKSSMIENSDGLHIEQNFANNVRAENRINLDGKWLKWDIELTNGSNKEVFLEAVLSLPVSLSAVKEYFDGLEVREELTFGRYRDSYPYVMPLAAVSDNKNFMALGLNPEFSYNDLIHGFQPAVNSKEYIQQGTKIALSPNEKFTIKFVLYNGETEFGTAEALEQYYKHFADLYHINKEYSVYNYMPHTSHRRGLTCEDILRTGYAGAMWGHGPYHTKGDEVGKWWNMGKYKNTLSYKHALGWERKDPTPERLRENIAIEYKMEFDNGYSLRRYHTCPNLTPEWIIDEVWPGYRPKDDMLASGNYYIGINGNYFTNEYNTPLGKHFREQTKEYFDIGIKDSSPGWINDVTYVVAHYRFSDPIAKRTPGRSFAKDKGTFVRGAMGLQQRNELIKNLYSNGYRCSMSWDNGGFSYTTGAHSSSSAIESGSPFETLTGHSFIPYARNLHGQKPLMAHTFTRGIKTGQYLLSGDIKDMNTVREYFRYTSEQLVIFCLKYGLELDPTGYLFGNQYLTEMTPLMIDNVTRGMNVTPGGKLDNGDLWMKHCGEGLNSLLIIANEKANKITSRLSLKESSWGGNPVLIDYFGDKTSASVKGDTTWMVIDINAREVLAFNLVASINTPQEAEWETSIISNGIEVVAQINIKSKSKLQLNLNNQVQLYEIVGVTVNGKESLYPEDKLELAIGNNTVKIKYLCPEFKFSTGEWDKVELFKKGKTNFQIMADKGYSIYPYKTKLGFEHGTASLFQNFVIFYDWEDGILNNLEIPKVIDKNTDKQYSGWTIALSLNNKHGISIDMAKKEIIISGTSQGEIRRSAIVLLRLIDRKYPHVGSFYPLSTRNNGDVDRTVNIDFNKVIDWRNRKKDKPTSAFFRDLPEEDFLLKPLLNRKYDNLYKNKAIDFTGCYKMKSPVFIFEPTYNDKFVYGFKQDSSSWNKFKDEMLKKRK